jgi:hypothetical protein
MTQGCLLKACVGIRQAHMVALARPQTLSSTHAGRHMTKSHPHNCSSTSSNTNLTEKFQQGMYALHTLWLMPTHRQTGMHIHVELSGYFSNSLSIHERSHARQQHPYQPLCPTTMLRTLNPKPSTSPPLNQTKRQRSSQASPKPVSHNPPCQQIPTSKLQSRHHGLESDAESASQARVQRIA